MDEISLKTKLHGAQSVTVVIEDIGRHIVNGSKGETLQSVVGTAYMVLCQAPFNDSEWDIVLLEAKKNPLRITVTMTRQAALAAAH
ncbi:MAG: hypothetical protein WC773_04485 [Patescibacteria group bacterium]|jgi:hypothetical protein